MPDTVKIVSIVEGDGDRFAVPGLVRRILHERLRRYDILVGKSKVAKGKPKLLQKLENLLQYAILDGCDAILVLVDADKECPYAEATVIAEQVSKLNLRVPVAIVYAKAEYETWFLCNLVSNHGAAIREKLGIPANVHAPGKVEDIADAKGWLSRNMTRGRAYRETQDQEDLTYHIDLSLAHNRSRSFQRLCHAVEEIVGALDGHETSVTPLTVLS